MINKKTKIARVRWVSINFHFQAWKSKPGNRKKWGLKITSRDCYVLWRASAKFMGFNSLAGSKDKSINPSSFIQIWLTISCFRYPSNNPCLHSVRWREFSSWSLSSWYGQWYCYRPLVNSPCLGQVQRGEANRKLKLNFWIFGYFCYFWVSNRRAKWVAKLLPTYFLWRAKMKILPLELELYRWVLLISAPEQILFPLLSIIFSAINRKPKNYDPNNNQVK